MTNSRFLTECLKKNGAYIDFPFGDDIAVIKVRKKVFAQAFMLNGVETITLNCTAEGGIYYRQKYPTVVVRGYHCPRAQQPYFNTLPTNGLSDDVIIEMINHSYEKVLSNLPKYMQKELNS